jgi:mono/diheme cytochrome c family protein
MHRRLMVIALLAMAAGLLGWAVTRERTVRRGAGAFHSYGCAHCHGSSGAPKLANVTSKYDEETLRQFIRDPESVYKARGRKPFNEGYLPMARLNVTDGDAKAIVAYLKEQAE